MSNPMFALKGPKMQKGAKGYETNFPLEHASKDIRFAQLLGDEQGISMGVSGAANGMLIRLIFTLISLLSRLQRSVLIIILSQCAFCRVVQSRKRAWSQPG